MKSIKVCEYSWSRSFHDDLILQDQASGERSQDQWSSGCKYAYRCSWTLNLNLNGLLVIRQIDLTSPGVRKEAN